MLDSSEDVLSRQHLEVLAGMVMAEPIQKAAAAHFADCEQPFQAMVSARFI
ncbi:hypothetical protein [Mesorhizobium sp.]|uniref:hypothetical protein n=1 Tax=Mesorhizobium sp. TaxID=1871066 RepID=UPI0025BE5A22|nr:hypothetical protein [Mesorhizobium sp.]